jgi:hypothetical protein
MSVRTSETPSTLTGVPLVLPVLVLAALTALPATAPLTDLPPAADPCIALTPAVINQLRTTGTLTPLVSDAVSTSTLIVAGRSLTGCPPTSDPDPAAIRAHVCPLLTAEGVEALANRFGATPAVRADLGPERVAIARNALQCDGPAVAASEAAATGEGVVVGETSADRASSNTVDRTDRGVLQELVVVAVAIATLIGVILLLVRARLLRRWVGEGRVSRRVHLLHHLPRAARSGRQRVPEADRDRAEGQQRSTPGDDSDLRGRPENHSDSYDELLEGLRREVAELQRTDEAFKTGSARPDDPREH